MIWKERERERKKESSSMFSDSGMNLGRQKERKHTASSLCGLVEIIMAERKSIVRPERAIINHTFTPVTEGFYSRLIPIEAIAWLPVNDVKRELLFRPLFVQQCAPYFFYSYFLRFICFLFLFYKLFIRAKGTLHTYQNIRLIHRENNLRRKASSL